MPDDGHAASAAPILRTWQSRPTALPEESRAPDAVDWKTPLKGAVMVLLALAALAYLVSH